MSLKTVALVTVGVFAGRLFHELVTTAGLGGAIVNMQTDGSGFLLTYADVVTIVAGLALYWFTRKADKGAMVAANRISIGWIAYIAFWEIYELIAGHIVGVAPMF